METFRIAKATWTDADFDTMGWHDATLWSTLADPEHFEFLIDLDYIFQWVGPLHGETHYRFRVAPVTMIFENAHSIRIDIESSQGVIEIADLHRENPRPTPNGRLEESTYRFDCQQGEISMVATGYRMIVRRAPVLASAQSLSLPQRGGVSFEREPAFQP